MTLRFRSDADIPFPPHRYVPGKSPRHPEDWFDTLKVDVTPETPVDQLDQTQAWAAGLAYFNADYFWECHEVLEAVWMQTPQPSAEREMTQAIIQLANARLKLRMEKPRAAQRLCTMVRGHLSGCPTDQSVLGVCVHEVTALVAETERDALAG